MYENLENGCQISAASALGKKYSHHFCIKTKTKKNTSKHIYIYIYFLMQEAMQRDPNENPICINIFKN